jgi:hypothetical protein
VVSKSGWQGLYCHLGTLGKDIREGDGVKKRLAALGVFVAALSLSIVVFWRHAPIFSTIESPDKTYVLHLRGKRSRPALPVIMHWVYCEAYRNGRQVIRRQQLHSGDGFDPGFDDLYPDHTWVSSSTLMFHRGEVGEDGLDTVNVTNNTSKPIKFLRVQSGEMFLLLDLPPQTRTKLSPSAQTWLSWLEVEGQFEDGKSIPYKGVNFTIKVKGPFTYEIAINDDGPTISSSQLPVYRRE